MDEYTCCYGPYAKTTYKCTKSLPHRSKKTAFVEINKNLRTKRGFTLLGGSIHQFFAFSWIIELWRGSAYTTALKLYTQKIIWYLYFVYFVWRSMKYLNLPLGVRLTILASCSKIHFYSILHSFGALEMVYLWDLMG